MVIKKNPYSESLLHGLQAVKDLTAPDYILSPIDPTATMAMAGATAANISPGEARDVFMAMIHAWTRQSPPGLNHDD